MPVGCRWFDRELSQESMESHQWPWRSLLAALAWASSFGRSAHPASSSSWTVRLRLLCRSLCYLTSCRPSISSRLRVPGSFGCRWFDDVKLRPIDRSMAKWRGRKGKEVARERRCPSEMARLSTRQASGRRSPRSRSDTREPGCEGSLDSSVRQAPRRGAQTALCLGPDLIKPSDRPPRPIYLMW